MNEIILTFHDAFYRNTGKLIYLIEGKESRQNYTTFLCRISPLVG